MLPPRSKIGNPGQDLGAQPNDSLGNEVDLPREATCRDELIDSRLAQTRELGDLTNRKELIVWVHATSPNWRLRPRFRRDLPTLSEKAVSISGLFAPDFS